MNYFQTLQDSLRLLRTTKFIWLLGFISILVRIIQPLFQYLHDNPFLICIYAPASFLIIYYSFVAESGLLYAIYKKTLKQDTSFSDVWQYAKSKVIQIIGLSILNIPAIFLVLFVYQILRFRVQNSVLLGFAAFITSAFIGSIFIFGICAITIHNVKAASATLTGILITLNNFFHVLVINGASYLIRWLLIGLVVLAFSLFSNGFRSLLIFDSTTYQKIMGIPAIAVTNWIFDLILTIPAHVVLAFGYLQFIKKIPYPALSNEQNAT